MRLVLVTEGSVEPTTIPILDPDGTPIGVQRDPSGEIVRTVRRDDLIQAIADRAHGVVVPAELGDQAGAVRDLIAGYARTPQASSTAEQDISRAWVAALIAALLLLLHTLTRRTMALAVLVLGAGLSGSARGQSPVNRGDRAWELGDFRAAAEAYLAQVRRREGGETAWYNLGTAALAISDTATARRALERTARSIDPDMRYRSLFNLGLLRLRQAAADSGHATAYLDAAFQHYREALLLRPGSRDAQWNLELAVRKRPPSNSGGSAGPGGGGGTAEAEQPSGLSPSQAEQILNSMAEEERQTLLDRITRRRRGRETRGWKEW